MTCIQIPYDRGIRLAMPEQIIRVEAYSNYSKIYFATGHPMNGGQSATMVSTASAGRNV
jgi:hypothetical protein